MKRTVTTLLIALTGSAALVLSACGGGGCNPCTPPHVPLNCSKTPEQCK